MKRSVLLASVGALFAVAMLALGFTAGRANIQAVAQEASAAPMITDRAGIEQIVREYLLANPELMLEVQAALEAKQQEQQRATQLSVIKDARADIFNAATDGVVGNPDGKVTVVEFFDYNCGYCKRALPDMLALTADNPDLRFVLKEFPILGPDSQQAHVVSMAFHRLMPEKFGEFHTALLGSQGRANEESAIRLAVEFGADEAKLREEMKNPAITDAINQTYELANKLSITGTPSYVIGDEVVFGAIGQQVLAEKIAAVRAACTEATC